MLDQETLEGNRYLRTQARLAAAEGPVLEYTQVHPQGVIAAFRYMKNSYYSFYLKPNLRHSGNYKRVVQELEYPILTSSNCDLEPYLLANGVEHLCLGKLLPNEYTVINDYYGNDRAKRSGIPFINHIQEGLNVLYTRQNEVDSDVSRAFCLHPIFQDPFFFDLTTRSKIGNLALDPVIVCLAMEYREIANAHLVKNHGESYKISSSWEVNEMLIADKIQNYKDFQATYVGTPEEYKTRDEYFKNWLARLEVSLDTYKEHAWNLKRPTEAPFFDIDGTLISLKENY